MAMGLPVVATNGGAFPEIVDDGRTGLLAERGDVGSLANALQRLVTDPALRVKMGRAGRQRAEQHFSWDHSTARLLEFYRHLAGVSLARPSAEVRTA
jgi:glycosyltransferase involved in cell wall biosynthesis